MERGHRRGRARPRAHRLGNDPMAGRLDGLCTRGDRGDSGASGRSVPRLRALRRAHAVAAPPRGSPGPDEPAARGAGGRSRPAGGLAPRGRRLRCMALRRYALPGAADWSLAAELAFALVRGGDRSRLGTSLDAFSKRGRAFTQEPPHLTQWGWALCMREIHRESAARPRRRSPFPGRRESEPIGRLGHPRACAARQLGEAPTRSRPDRWPGSSRRPPHGPWPQRRSAVRGVDVSVDYRQAGSIP